MLKNRITYGLVTVVLFLFIYLQEHRMTYMAFYAVLIIPLLSFGLAVFSKRYFSISEKLTRNLVTKGEEIVYTVIARNPSFLPCSFAQIRLEGCEIGLDIEEKERYFSLLPYKNREFTFQIRSVYRGEYTVGIKDITFYDFLGLFRFKLTPKKLHKLLVTPRIISIPDLSLDSATDDATTSKNYLLGEDYSNVAELRAFQPTDSYRQIHWKASAKKGELISKNFHEEEQHAATFFIDNVRTSDDLKDALDAEDKMIEMVASAMSHCYRAGYPVSMQALREKRVDFTTDFTRLYESISRLPFWENSDFNLLLDKYSRSDQMPMNLFIFPRVVSDVLLSVLQSLIFIGNYITIFVFDDVDDEMIIKLKSLDVNIIFIEEKVKTL